jgi:hypothetical protein
MSNRICDVWVLDGRRDPAEAEIWISVRPERLTSSTQVQGRLMGPRCPYASTVEVAYPFREQSRQYEKEGEPHLILRAIIPEPSFWDPESPFLYEGPVELWQGKERCDRVNFRHGLRDLRLGPRGLRLNGRSLTLHGVERDVCSEEECLSLHQANCNLFVAPLTPEAAPLWDLADRFGFLVLGRITTTKDFKFARALTKHPCCLGWLLPPGVVPSDLLVVVASALEDASQGHFLGMELQQRPTEPLPPQVTFVVCPETLLPELTEIGQPRLIVRHTSGHNSQQPVDAAARPEILGWIEM